MAVVKIGNWVNKQISGYFLKDVDIAKKVGVTPSIVCLWRRDPGRNVSLDVAIRIYLLDGTVIHPFSEESLQYEINKGVENDEERTRW